MTRDSKFLSLVLRHHPEKIGITLDRHGWADVDALIAGMARTRTFDRPYLEKIVRTDAKQRYAFNADHTKIRANQGHSIPVDVEPEQLTPPDILWHGTGEKSVAAILKEGLRPMGFTCTCQRIPRRRKKSAAATAGRSSFRSTPDGWPRTV